MPTAAATDAPGRAIVTAGALAGVLDLTAAIALYASRGVAPVRIPQSIASGLLGASAYQGGLGTAALGTALHFFIAFTAAAAYYAASRKLDVLLKRPVACGLLYGVGVYVVMNFVVVPLSAIGWRPPARGMVAIMLVIHMLCVGLPIALAVRRASAPRSA